VKLKKKKQRAIRGWDGRGGGLGIIVTTLVGETFEKGKKKKVLVHRQKNKPETQIKPDRERKKGAEKK